MGNGQSSSWSELFARWQGGDKAAGNELFVQVQHALGQMVRKRARGYLGEDTRSDLEQSAAASFLRKVDGQQFRFNDTQGMLSYLKYIVWGKFNRRLRDRNSGLPLAEGGPADCRCDYQAVDEDDALADLLSRLRPRTRRIVQLVFEGHTMAEICAAESCGRHTVRRHLKQVGDLLSQSETAADDEVGSPC